MNMEKNKNVQKLRSLITLELIGITFIRDYIQFLFEEPLLNIYTLPQVKILDKVLQFNQNGYYDKLCSLIGKTVIDVYENNDNLVIKFEGEIELQISLKLEDRSTLEAAMLRLGANSQWTIW